MTASVFFLPVFYNFGEIFSIEKHKDQNEVKSLKKSWVVCLFQKIKRAYLTVADKPFFTLNHILKFDMKIKFKYFK